MGKTAIILVASFTVTVGLYQMAIKQTEQSVQNKAATHSYRAQAEEIAKSGVELATDVLKSPNIKSYLNKGAKVGLLNKELLDGTVEYVIDNQDGSLPEDYLRIISIGRFKDEESTYTALVKYVGSGIVEGKQKDRWKIERAFIFIPPEEIATFGDDDDGDD